MQYYTHIARFTYSYINNVNRNAIKISILKFSLVMFPFTYSLSQNIVKLHVSNYLNIKKINTKFTYN
jgi:hypothetical protein